MPSFTETINPTPYSFFDSDEQFQTDAESIVTFVKRKLGDDVLSVELTRKEIWACFEESVCEYSRRVHEMKIQSELVNLLGMPTGSFDATNKYMHQTLEFFMRQAAPYATYAGVGGNYTPTLGYIDIQEGRQDYNIYTELKSFETDNVIYDTLEDKSSLRILEVFHFDPIAQQSTLLNASNITNFLATNFNYESYVNSTVFYVLPVFEDVLRRGMLEFAHKVRRSQYSYEIQGSNVRIYPIPGGLNNITKLYIKVYAGQLDPLSPSAFPGGDDSSVDGISGPENVPYGNIQYSTMTQPAKQWIRQYCLANCKELLGLIRGKMKSIPIPGSELTLDGDTLRSEGREDKKVLIDELKEFLSTLTNAKLAEQQATMAENLHKQLKYMAMPLGKAIFVG
jgi:hypothetical protein